MKTKYLLIPMILLCACRTTAGTKENSNMATKSAQTAGEKLLQKIVGGLSAKGQVYDCVITSNDVPDAEAIRKLIAKVPRDKINPAYYIMAHEPSIEIYAFEKGEQVVLYRDWSTRELRDDPASTELIKRANEKCPTPKDIK